MAIGPGCEPARESLEIPAGCQPLVSNVDCMLPYPSDYFMVADPSLPSGQRVELTSIAKLRTDEGRSADVADFRALDGFSTTNPIVFGFGVPVDRTGLTGIFDDYSATLVASSHTLLIDTTDNSLVAHFTDLDPRAPTDLRRALVIKPQVALQERRRYVVAVHGLRAPEGTLLAAPEGFRRLRDRQTGEDPALEALKSRYEDEIFPVTEAAGVARGRLQLAWDFTTGSDAHTLVDMLKTRAFGLAALAASPPIVEITRVTEDPNNKRFRLIEGWLTGPRVMAAEGPGQVLARADDGQVTLNGTTTFRFRAVVPRSIVDRPGPAPVVVFGHGYFGSAAAASSGEYNHELLEQAGAVALMTDWLGMAQGDLAEVVGNFGGEVWRSLRFGDRVHQGMLNQLTLIEAIVTVMNQAQGFNHPSGGALLDTDNLTYFGISNGHILGGVLLTLDVHVKKWVLQVGGASFSQMMFRAVPFERFLVLLDLRVPEALDQQKLHAQFQPQFDRFDPARFARYLNHPLPSGPPDPRGDVQVLLQYAIGDTSVPNFTSALHARLLDIPVLTPSVRRPWGLTTVGEQASPSRALTIYDFGIDDSFYAQPSRIAHATTVHDRIRNSPQVVTQTATLIRDSRIVHPCDGPCVLPLP